MFVRSPSPGCSSFLATGDFDGDRPGHQRPAGASTSSSTAPGDYVPEHPGHLLDVPPDDRLRAARRALVGAASALWLTRRRPDARASAGSAASAVLRDRRAVRWPTPSAGSSPRWAASRGSSFRTRRLDDVRMLTADGVSPAVGAAGSLISLIVFTLLYGVLAVVEVGLLLEYAEAGAAATTTPTADAEATRRRRRRARSRSPTEDGRRHGTHRPSGSSSSPSCGPATSSSRASTSASACCCPSSAATRPSAGC